MVLTLMACGSKIYRFFWHFLGCGVRFFGILLFLMVGSGCLYTAPTATTGSEAGASCVEQLGCAAGLFCMCERCVAHATAVYPSWCPNLDQIACDQNEGVCVDSCGSQTSPNSAECKSGLWFCSESQILVHLCASAAETADAGLSSSWDGSDP